MKKIPIITVILVFVVGAGGFYAGMKYQESKRSVFSRQFGDGQGSRGGGQFQSGTNRMGLRPVTGEIISSDDKSITVKLTDGSSKIVLLSEKTEINKADKANIVDLKAGEKVAVFGSDNSDGSVTAQTIQLNPTFNGRGNRTTNKAQKSPDAKEIIVEGGNYKFSPDKITLKKGEKTRILFKNKDGSHDFRVDELNIATAVVPSGEEDFVEFTPDKTGQFEFYCSVDGHRQMGMKGNFIVE